MKRFVWAHTAHKITEEQEACLVGIESVELPSDLADKLSNNYEGQNLHILAHELLDWCIDNSINYLIQPSGSLAFQMALGQAWEMYASDGNAVPWIYYSYSERVSEDIPQEDGTVKNVSIFNFQGFYSPSGEELPIGVVV